MKYRKTAAGVIVGLGVATLGFASASLLQIDGDTIQHGKSDVTAQHGVLQTDWALERDDNSVRSVNVTGLEDEAHGATLFVTVHFENGTSKEFPGVVVDAASERFSFAAGSYPTPESIKDIEAWLEG